MSLLDKMASSLLEPINPAFTILLAVYLFFWGSWFIQPFWNVYATSSALAAMSFFPSYIWGIWAMVVALLISRGALKPSYSNLQTGAILGFFHFFVVMVLLVSGNIQNPSWLAFALMSAYTSLVWVNVKVNSQHYDEIARRKIARDIG